MFFRLLAAGTIALWAGASAAAPFAYIPNYDDDTVSVIDLSTNLVVETVAVGDKPASVAVSSDGARVYVACRGQNSVDVIDGVTHQRIDRIDVCEPKQIAVGSFDFQLLVSTQCRYRYASGQQSIVYRVNISSHTVTRQIVNAFLYTDNFQAADKGVAFGQFDDEYLAVVSEGDKVAKRTFNVGGPTTTSVGDAPYEMMRFLGVGYARFFVANRTGDSVSMLDATGENVLVTIGVGDNPHGLAVSPDGAFLYVTNRNENTLSIVDLASNLEIDTVPVGSEPLGVSVHPLGSFVYVVNSGSDVVSVVDAASHQVVSNILVGRNPIGWGNFVSPQASISATPTSVDFGSVDVGAASPSTTVTVRNVGSGVLTLNTTLVTGTDGFDFELVSTTCLDGTSLGPQQTCTAEGRFTPTSYGTHQGYLQVGSDDVETPAFRVPFVGVGVAPDIHIDTFGDPLDSILVQFGSVTTGQNGIKTIDVRNVGNAPVEIGLLGGTDALAPPFAFTTNCSNTTLNEGESCSITLRFAPSGLGVVTDAFNLPSNDPNEANVSIGMRGSGSAVAVGSLVVADTIDPPLDFTLDFGGVDVGGSRTADVLLFNRGSINALTVSEVRLGGANADQFSLDFNVGGDDACGEVPIVVPGPINLAIPPQLQPDPCHVGVVLAPTNAGELQATVVIVSNTADGQPVEVALQAIGLGPEIDVPDDVAIGDVPVNDLRTAEVNIANIGTTPLNLSNMRLVGPAEFELHLDDGVAPCAASEVTLQSGHSCSVGVSFAPTEQGARDAVLLMESDDADEAAPIINVTAFGLPAIVDAGVPPDDAGPVDDAGLTDAGPVEDGGFGRDAGPSADAGPGPSEDAGPTDPPVEDCSCDATGNTSQPLGFAGLLALISFAVTRRRRAKPGRNQPAI